MPSTTPAPDPLLCLREPDVIRTRWFDDEDLQMDMPYVLIGPGPSTAPGPGPLVAAHRRGEAYVGWLSYSRLRDAVVGREVGVPFKDPSIEPDVCFHVLPSEADMREVLLCDAGAPPHPAGDIIEAPLPEKLASDLPALGWEVAERDGSTVIERRRHDWRETLLGIIPGWPGRLANPMIYVHRQSPKGQTSSRLRALDMVKLRETADELHAAKLRGEDPGPVVVPAHFAPKPGMCCHYIHVSEKGYVDIKQQVERFRRECPLMGRRWGAD